MAQARLLNILWMLAVLLLASTPVLNAAYPLWASGMTQFQTRVVQQAFTDAMGMARIILLTFDQDCDMYLDRYFAAKTDATFVQNIFKAILGISFDNPGLTADDLLNIMQTDAPPNILPATYGKLSISYGDHPRIPQSILDARKTCKTFGVRGYIVFSGQGIGGALISLCPDLFALYYSLDQTLIPSDDLKKKGIPGLTCDGLGDHETDFMRSPGQTMLHELIHWATLYSQVPDYSTKIRLESVRNKNIIKDYEGTNPGDPLSGYDAVNARKVRNLPDDGGYSEALNNVDNYALYAMAKTWSFLCDRDFAPAKDDLTDYFRRFYAFYPKYPKPNPGEPFPVVEPPSVKVADPKGIGKAKTTPDQSGEADPVDWEGGCTYFDEYDLYLCY